MADKPWKPGRRDRRVLLALLSGASNLSFLPLMRSAQVGSGRVAVVIARLESEGWVDGTWGPLGDHGRRRSYRLTARGRYGAMKALRLEDDHA